MPVAPLSSARKILAKYAPENCPGCGSAPEVRNIQGLPSRWKCGSVPMCGHTIACRKLSAAVREAALNV